MEQVFALSQVCEKLFGKKKISFLWTWRNHMKGLIGMTCGVSYD